MPARHLVSLLAWLLLASLVAVVVRLAWLGDDAYITLRTVENLVNGHGPVWNVGERAQTYTHPLWMLLLAAGRAVTGEAYFTTLGLGFVFTLATLLLVRRLAGTAAAACAALALLLGARAFGEYATSGLENPLVFTLVTMISGAAASCWPAHRRLLAIALLTGLSTCTRMDLILLCGPLLATAMLSVPWQLALRTALVGLLPLFAWVLFATIYYGTPCPTTAFAKAFTGIDSASLWSQGMHYLEHTVATDPVLLVGIVLGSTFGLAFGSLRCRGLAIGILLYSGYILRIGGDFMQGRLWTPPFVAAIAVTAQALGRKAWHWSVLAGLLAMLTFVPGLPHWLRPAAEDRLDKNLYHGIIDERSVYCGDLGLLSPTRRIPQPGAGMEIAHAMGRRSVVYVVRAAVGTFGFEAGEQAHVVDPWLCDPLLMRLPVRDPEHWRIGHFERRLPEGYLETLFTGQNRLHHAGLARYYDLVREVVGGPVFSWPRAVAAWRLATGAAKDDLVAFVAEDYRQPPRLSVPAAALAAPVAAGTLWFESLSVRIVYAGGIEVRWPAPAAASRMRLMLGGGVRYRLTFRRGDTTLAATTVHAADNEFFGQREHVVDVPAGAADFDALWIDDAAPQLVFTACVGGLELLP